MTLIWIDYYLTFEIMGIETAVNVDKVLINIIKIKINRYL